jgi:hypothetical protein
VRLDELERRLRARLKALPPAARAELLHVLRLPDLDRVERIGEFWSYPQSRAFAEILIDCEEDKAARAVVFGLWSLDNGRQHHERKAMDESDALKALAAAGRDRRAAVRGVGYIALAGRIGWDAIRSFMIDEESYRLLRQSYADASLVPEDVAFSGDPRPFLEEVARSSYHPRVRETVKKLLDNF